MDQYNIYKICCYFNCPKEKTNTYYILSSCHMVMYSVCAISSYENSLFQQNSKSSTFYLVLLIDHKYYINFINDLNVNIMFNFSLVDERFILN